MSRKPIFPNEMRSTQIFQTGRQADTRVTQMKKTEFSLLQTQPHSPPFSGLSTTNQSMDMSQKMDENSPVIQTVVRLIKEQEGGKLKEMLSNQNQFQTQLEGLRTMVLELRGQRQQYDQLNKLIYSIEESVTTKIVKATDELVKQQEQFQINYSQRLTDLRTTIDQMESNSKKSNNEKFQQECNSKINVLEDQMIAQFKTFQNNYQNFFMQQCKKLSEEMEQKTFVKSNDTQKIEVSALQKVQNELSNQSQKMYELNIDVQNNGNRINKLEQQTKNWVNEQNELKNIIEEKFIFIDQIQNKVKQVQQSITQNQEINFTVNENNRKQNEELRKSYQDLLFSFKQIEQQRNWVDEYNKQKQEISSQQVQVFSYDDNEDDESEKNEKNDKFEKCEKIETVDNLDKQEQDKKKEDEEEITYQIDEQGHLMDDQGVYILDENGKMIQLSESQILQLKKENMIYEEDE